jgi:hypothetical protein
MQDLLPEVSAQTTHGGRDNFFEGPFMGIDVSMLMVFCAAIAALALGVMLGYMACKTLFDVLRFHARLSTADSRKAETQVVQI